MKKLFLSLVMIAVSSFAFASFTFTVKNDSPTSGINACTYTITAWSISDNSTPTPCACSGCTGGIFCSGPWVIAPQQTYTFSCSCSGSPNWSTISVTAKTGTCTATTFGNIDASASARHCDNCTQNNYQTVWDVVSNGVYTIHADIITGRFSDSDLHVSEENVAYALGTNSNRAVENTNELVSSLTSVPNPVSSLLNISYELTQDANVAISVYDVTGKEVLNSKQGFLVKGRNSISLDVTSLPNGMYSYTFNAGELMLTRKFNIVR